MEARIENIEGDVAEVKEATATLPALALNMQTLQTSLTSLQASVQTLLERSAVERGGRSMLLKVGAASSTGGGMLGAAAAWLIDHFGTR